MKNIFILLLFFSTFLAFSQFSVSQLLPGEEVKVKDIKKGDDYFYGSLLLKTPYINDELSWELGFKAAAVFNEYFGFGFGYYSTFSRNLQVSDDSQGFIRAQNFGPEFDLSIMLGKYAIISIENHFGFGIASYEISRTVQIANFNELAYYFVYEPSFSLSINVSSTFYVHTRAGYRITSGIDFDDSPEPVPNDILDAPFVSLGLKVLL